MDTNTTQLDIQVNEKSYADIQIKNTNTWQIADVSDWLPKCCFSHASGSMDGNVGLLSTILFQT